MPNRIIKESICTSEDVARLSMGAEILFYRLIVKADDFGAYYGNETIIKNTCFPLKDTEIKSDQVKAWLSELIDAGLVIHYQADDGRKYIQFAKWGKHQQIRAQKRKFPAFDDTCKQLKSSDSKCNQLISDDSKCSRNPIQSNPNPNPNKGAKRADRPEAEKTDLEKAMDDFAAARRAMKKPLTDKAKELTLRELEKLAPGDEAQQIAIINQSIQRGWQGVFPIKDDEAQPQPRKTKGPPLKTPYDKLPPKSTDGDDLARLAMLMGVEQ